MDLAKSQKIVKVLGILDIISAVLYIIGAVGSFAVAGGGAAAEDIATNTDLQTGVGVFIVLGILALAAGVVDLLEGIFALRAAKDASKVKPLWIFAIIGVVLGVMALIATITNGGENVLSDVFSLALSCFTFYLANNIKKLAK